MAQNSVLERGRMAPVGHLLCDVGAAGELLEFGVDCTPAACASKAVQADFAGRAVAAKEEVGASARSGALASSILQLAVGLLGLEVHEKPNSWAEVWHSYEARPWDLAPESLSGGGGQTLHPSGRLAAAGAGAPAFGGAPGAPRAD